MLLAVDTSTQWMGICLYDDAMVIAETIWRTSAHHTVELAPEIDRMLAHCGLKPENIKQLAIATGPGSFTGLRIGMAVIKGMALALNATVIGIPTLDIIALPQPILEMPLIAVLQAGRGRLAAARYHATDGVWAQETPPQVFSPDDFAESIHESVYICGELSNEERNQLSKKRKKVILASPANSTRRPSFLAELAWKRALRGEKDDIATLAPSYLHITGAEIAK